MSWFGVGKFRDIRDSWVLSWSGVVWEGQVRFSQGGSLLRMSNDCQFHSG